MNWRDSIRASDNRHIQGRFPKREKLTQRLVPYSENKGYASNPRRFLHSIDMINDHVNPHVLLFAAFCTCKIYIRKTNVF